MPLTLINWSFKWIPHEIVGYIVLPQPPTSLTINVIFIVLKRGILVAQMLGRRTHRSLWEKIKSTFLVNPALLSPGQPTRDWWRGLVRVRPVKQPRNSFQTDLTATSADLLPTGQPSARFGARYKNHLGGRLPSSQIGRGQGDFYCRSSV